MKFRSKSLPNLRFWNRGQGHNDYAEIKTEQNITFTFVKALYLEDDIWVEYWRNREYRTCSWSEYEGIGEAATAAVVAAQWSCQGLQILAGMVQQGTINRINAKMRLEQLSSQAYGRRFRLSLPSGRDAAERSRFD
ncbi:uncharacterized protein N7469_002267 [Penicillium citrinum]|uniref:Uncharacterized protein n=1 Tax=Penicillium citrinum TaxID=5077 RepID=A0A9W9P9Z7_PENCI|nr:uncharacterized protein N7469_002205 [Penicillium citrinum]XP_056503681.1 uncharacterized protein N7469_002267 [Penicillium citrinum]KAJ5240614.1 hypothetical protein N7469_002205 [Penicillium citrinum]KAJ5240676.1 hypothetical protein N7469_002267 [Penicillium citrinum]